MLEHITSTEHVLFY